MKDAKDTIEVAQYRHKKNEQRFKETEEETNQAMDKLGRLELEITKSFGDFADLFEKIKNSRKVGYGYDAYTETYCDMIKSGIVDPTKVNRSALEKSASVAAMILTTESLVADKKEPVAPAAPASPDMGGMGGMY